MSQSTRRIQRNRKRRIEKRLRNIAWCDQEHPMFGASNVHYELSERVRGFSVGGIGASHELARSTGLLEEINSGLNFLKVHLPYHESDHVLNIAYNALSGGRCLEDLEWLRNDEVYMDALGAQRIPDPTTAGDFCRRFKPEDVEALMDAINEVRLRVWAQQPASFFEEAVIEADGTFVDSTGECKEGMDFGYKKSWSYHPLLVSLANTQEPLYLVNRSGNRNSHEGATPRYDQAIDDNGAYTERFEGNNFTTFTNGNPLVGNTLTPTPLTILLAEDAFEPNDSHAPPIPLRCPSTAAISRSTLISRTTMTNSRRPN